MCLCVWIQQKKVYVICTTNFITPNHYADFSILWDWVSRRNVRSGVPVYFDFATRNDFHRSRQKTIKQTEDNLYDTKSY